MPRKREKIMKKNAKSIKKAPFKEKLTEEDMDDEIDVFHKEADFVPFVSTGSDSSEDDDQPVLDLKDSSADDDGSDDDGSDDDDDEKSAGSDVDSEFRKYERQQKYMQTKAGGVNDDDMFDDGDDEEGKEQRRLWGSSKNAYYDGDNADFELQSSDEELADEEEAEVIRMHKERAEYLTMEDFGLEEEDPTMEDCVPKGERHQGGGTGLEEHNKEVALRKEMNEMSKEEQAEALDRHAPELPGMISELSIALGQLEHKVEPLLSKMKAGEGGGRMNCVEVKRLLLLSYCQGITCYLLLKAEGHSVRDHPIIAHLVAVKGMLARHEKFDERVDEEMCRETEGPPPPPAAASTMQGEKKTPAFSDAPLDTSDHDLVSKIGIESMEMLKLKASLEEKVGKRKKQQQQRLRDSDDEEEQGHGVSGKKTRVARALRRERIDCGDDDVPERDDVGMRRLKHERRVLARAAAALDDDDRGDGHGDEEEDSRKRKVVEEEEGEAVGEEGGRRAISRAMEKNRGLTRKRNKEVKNPRKKYKLKHRKAVTRRKGQVRDIRIPCGGSASYGGEPAGINASVSHSIRFNN